MTVFLPSCSINAATEHLNQHLGCYYQVEAPLSIFLEPTFFQKYIKSGMQYQGHKFSSFLLSNKCL
jgi:hypothetical protein